MPYSIKVFQTSFNPGATQSETHGSMNTTTNVNPDTTFWIPIPPVMVDEA